MQIEEAIEKLKETAKQCRNSKECWENEDCCDCYVEVEDIFAIETVLNYIETMHKEFDRLEGIEDNTAMLKIELEKKDRIIEKLKRQLDCKEILRKDMPEDTRFIIMTNENYERNFVNKED